MHHHNICFSLHLQMHLLNICLSLHLHLSLTNAHNAGIRIFYRIIHISGHENTPILFQKKKKAVCLRSDTSAPLFPFLVTCFSVICFPGFCCILLLFIRILQKSGAAHTLSFLQKNRCAAKTTSAKTCSLLITYFLI